MVCGPGREPRGCCAPLASRPRAVWEQDEAQVVSAVVKGPQGTRTLVSACRASVVLAPECGRVPGVPGEASAFPSLSL